MTDKRHGGVDPDLEADPADNASLDDADEIETLEDEEDLVLDDEDDEDEDDIEFDDDDLEDDEED